MKLKDIKTKKGQQELFQALIRWNVEQNDFTSLTELLNSSATLEFIKDYMEDVQDVLYKEEAALKLQQFFVAKAENILLINNFKKAVYEKATDPEAFSRSLPELNTTDKNQPDAINKLMCAQFSSEIKPTDVFFFPCAGRGSDALYVCNTYSVPKDNCFFIENNLRLCLRLISLGFKNVICGDILSNITWNKLYNMLKEKNMIINKTLMNPPYDGSLHLKVLEKVLINVTGMNDDELTNAMISYFMGNDLKEATKTPTSEYRMAKITSLVIEFNDFSGDPQKFIDKNGLEGYSKLIIYLSAVADITAMSPQNDDLDKNFLAIYDELVSYLPQDENIRFNFTEEQYVDMFDPATGSFYSVRLDEERIEKIRAKTCREVCYE